MNKFTKTIAAIVLIVTAIVVAGCTKPDEPNNGGNNNGQNDTIVDQNDTIVDPINDSLINVVMIVTTYSPQNITATTAKCGGDVIVTQGLSLTEIGVCWSKDSIPTVDQNSLSSTVWNEPFVCSLMDLEPNTTYFVRAYVLRGLEYYFGEVKSFTTEESGGDISGQDYVDLGLPSGTLWAACNVGADKPEDYGEYYSWSETEPKDFYAWNTYRYCEGSMNSLTKYCNNANYGYNGFTDTLTLLLPEDDAARANLGDEWRIPTKEEWQELYQNTTISWISKNGVYGKLFTASNENSIFLPAAGFRHEYRLVNAGDNGYYWSNTIFTDLPYYVEGFNFNSVTSYIDKDGRLYGLSVRAVCSAK